MTSPWPVPVGATQILPPSVQADQHDLWLATRREGLGGSDIAAVLGLSTFATPYEVWLDKTGRLPPEDSTYLMERGHRFESPCAQWFCDETGLSAKKTGTWRRDDEPWMQANPDRFLSDGAGYEGKIVGEDWGRHWKFGPAQHAAYQALWCMAVTGLDRWYIAAAMDNRFQWWRIPRDDRLLDEVVDRCGTWWYRHVVADSPPEVDGAESTTEALVRAYAQPEPAWRPYGEDCPEPLSDMVEFPGLTGLAARRRALKQLERETAAELRRVENEIKAGLGHARVGLEDGVPVLGWPGRLRVAVDTKLARDTAPQLFAATPYRQLEVYQQ